MSDSAQKLALDGGPKSIEEPIPFAGFGAELIGEEEEKLVLDTIRSRKLCRLTHTFAESYTRKFEDLIKERSGSPYVLAVNSCASALHVAMVALNIGPGDEVLVSAAGWFSIASAAIHVGAVPVPVEFDESLSMDPADLEAKITSRSKAVVVVQWRGLPANMDRILEVAKKHNLHVVEDVAQSFGGSYKGQFLGTIGDVGCFSFNMHKVITAGEGGAVLVKEGPLYKRSVNVSGFYNFYRHDFNDGETRSMPAAPMLNFRMPEMCGAMAFAQMAKLDTILGILRGRRDELLAGLKEIPELKLAPRHDPEGECGYTLPLVFETAEKAKFFFNAMKAEGALVSSVMFGFGGGEGRGTGALVVSEGFDPVESGSMAVASSWRCLTEQIGVTDKLNPWKLRDDAPAPLPEGIVPKSQAAFNRVVVFKTNTLMEPRHTAATLAATRKVVDAMKAAGHL